MFFHYRSVPVAKCYFFFDLHLTIFLINRVCFACRFHMQSFVMIVDGHRQRTFGIVLANYMFIQSCNYLRRTQKTRKRFTFCLYIGRRLIIGLH